MGDAIGTTRVTVTRLRQELERNGAIGYSKKIASFCMGDWGFGCQVSGRGLTPDT
ncbi:helix-turn-helix domain-containing protein [Nodosilinea sp. LEGE 07298]|uniref:helix-turn-helix domain-containing protein n=1 Tax=Nodosilinea sp. LEGE 07298 TaxID=2777970 RepID=UPI001D149C88